MLSIEDVKIRILEFIFLYEKPVSVKRLADCLGDPPELINLSLAGLIQDEKIQIERTDGENYVIAAGREIYV